MSDGNPFDSHVEQYEQWFIDHPLAYVSELHAVRELLPPGVGMEIGVGTGRFAAPLGIAKGVEPSAAMAALAGKKGIEVSAGAAEKLPFGDRDFDFVLMVTTVCFLEDMDLAFNEARRVLRPGGAFVIGFVDRESPIGKEYRKRKDESLFYKNATFYSVEEIVLHLKQAGFDQFEYRQTLFKPLDDMEAPDPVRPGQGEGSFVVVKAVKRQGTTGETS
jgi:SAM-dependent methyltransferase